MSSKDAINLDYVKPLRDAVLRPLAELGSSGASQALEVMNHYSLLRYIQIVMIFRRSKKISTKLNHISSFSFFQGGSGFPC